MIPPLQIGQKFWAVEFPPVYAAEVPKSIRQVTKNTLRREKNE